MYTWFSSAKKFRSVPSIWTEVERWMKLSRLSRSETGRARGSGDGGGGDEGRIL